MASFYKDWGAIGGTTNFLAYGEFPETSAEPDSLYMPRGLIVNRNVGGLKPVDQASVTEDVTYGWYEKGDPKHPWSGETKPIQEDPEYRPGSGAIHLAQGTAL